MKDKNNKNEEVNIFFDRIENFFMNIVDDTFIEIILNKSLICDNIHENDKQMIEFFIKNDKQLNFRHFRYVLLNIFFINLACIIDNAEDKVILKILSAFSINYVRPILSKKIKIYEKETMIAFGKIILTKFNKKIKNIIFKEFEENNYNNNNDNFIKNVYLDNFNNIFTVYEYYRKTTHDMISAICSILILIFFYPLLFKLKFGLLQNIFNIGFASIYQIFVLDLFNEAKKNNNNYTNTKENELKNIIYSFFQNINIIVESNTLEIELNKVLKHVESIMYSNNGSLNKYTCVYTDPYFLKQMARYKLINTGVSILINDRNILFFLEMMKPKIVIYIEKKKELYKKLASTRDLIDILNVEHYQVSKTIAWNNNHEMHPKLFVLQNVTLKYEDKDGTINTVLENINLIFETGSAHFVYGNSGGGKTSFLNALMKRIKISNGIIKFLGIHEEYTYFSIRQYLTYMTSESALFHKDLYYNITYGIDEKFLKENKKEIMETITKYMTLFGLEKLIPTMKTTNAIKLSKGQTQRVAIIRLLIDIIFNDTRILFLDEFTSNIDNKTEEIIFTELRNLQQKYHFTLIYVSHNQYNKKYSDYSYEIDVENKNIIKKETQKTVL
jgi:ABC-type lipoprotein export system ATPase subunit